MRTVGKPALIIVGVVLMAGPISAQRDGRSVGGPVGVLLLLQDPQVQKELNLDKEQGAKIPDAIMEALAKTLKPSQLRRLHQIALQRRGNGAFGDAQVQKELKVTKAQKEELIGILKDAEDTARDLFRWARGRDPRQVQEKMIELDKLVTKKIQEVLTDDQKEKWKKMLGEPFRFDPRGGRGPRQDR